MQTNETSTYAEENTYDAYELRRKNKGESRAHPEAESSDIVATLDTYVDAIAAYAAHGATNTHARAYNAYAEKQSEDDSNAANLREEAQNARDKASRARDAQAELEALYNEGLDYNPSDQSDDYAEEAGNEAARTAGEYADALEAYAETVEAYAERAEKKARENEEAANKAYAQYVRTYREAYTRAARQAYENYYATLESATRTARYTHDPAGRQDLEDAENATAYDDYEE